jgi:hypothetical protein
MIDLYENQDAIVVGHAKEVVAVEVDEVVHSDHDKMEGVLGVVSHIPP